MAIATFAWLVSGCLVGWYGGRLLRAQWYLHRGHRWQSHDDGWHCTRCGLTRQIGDAL